MMTNASLAAPVNRVPRVTLDFWLIKLMAVTMGETAADYLAVNLGLGLTMTSLLMTWVLIVALVFQFAQRRYVPRAYWLAVVLISIVGTRVTDNLEDNFGVALTTTTAVFTVALALTSWSGTGPREHFPSLRCSRSGARLSTDLPSCSPSRWERRPAIQWPKSSGWDTLPRGSSSA